MRKLIAVEDATVRADLLGTARQAEEMEVLS